jgi:hypothetical protein
MALKFFNDSDSIVTFANEYTASIKYDRVDTVPLGSHVLYEMDSTWWGYVGKVIATIAYNFTTELIIQYDQSVAGFTTTSEAREYFDDVV